MTILDGNSRTTCFGSNHGNVTLFTDCNSSVKRNNRMGSGTLDCGRGGFHDRFTKNINTRGACNYNQDRYEHHKSQINHYNRKIPKQNIQQSISNSAGHSNRGNQEQSLNKGTYIGNDFHNNNRNHFQEVQMTSLIGNSYGRDTSLLNDMQNKNESILPKII